MSGYVLLEQIEAVDDVLQRWHKEVDFLQAVAQAKKIPFFYRQETRIRPTDGMMVHFCLQFDSLRCIDSARHLYKRMSGIHLAIPVFSKGYRPKQGKVAP